MSDLELSEVWEALRAAGATIYEWTEDGVAFGCQVIRIGSDKILSASDSEGYQIGDYDEDIELVAVGDYDEEEALIAASDLDGYFGIVGIPGSKHHRSEWFPTQEEADTWAQTTRDAIMEANPVLVVAHHTSTARDAFDAKYRDGTRVYFVEKHSGREFEPRVRMYS